MTSIKNRTFIRKAKDITISSALTLTLLSTGFMLPGCSSNQDAQSGNTYEEVSYSTGIKSIINEVAPGEFKIMDEMSVPIDSAAAVVNYLDGHTDTLTPEASKALIYQQISEGGFGSNNALTSMLMYGGMGYMLSRMMNNGYMNQHRANGAAASSVYNNPATYNKSQGVMQDVNKSRTARTVNTRPAGGKSGFFSGKTTGSAAS